MSSFHSLSNLLRDRLGLRKQRVDTFLWLLTAVIDQGTVRLWRLASVAPTVAKVESTRRRFERFFASQTICWNWRARLCWDLLGRPSRCDLIFDRTQWFVGKTPVNILVLAVSTKRFTIPLLWCFFRHQGTCSATDCGRLIEQFITLFGKNCINEVLADREFGNAPMVEMLFKADVNFTIRAKSGNQVMCADGKKLSLASVCRKRGSSIRNERQFRFVAQTTQDTFYVACSFKQQNAARPQSGKDRSTKTEQMIVITSHRPKNAVKRYRNRWAIEVMFSDLKSKGFNLEDTRMTKDTKLDVLLSIVAIAYVWVCASLGKAKLKIPKKKHGYPARSWFRTALVEARKRLRNRHEKLINVLQQNVMKTERVG